MTEGLVKNSLAAYREGFFFSRKPKVKPIKAELKNDLVLVTTGKITIEGKLSGLSLIGEEYWRRAHDIMAIYDVASDAGSDAFDFGRFDQFGQVLDEYASSIHVLLDKGYKGEAKKCMARLIDAIGAEDVEIDPTLVKRFTRAEFEKLGYFERGDKTRARMFDGRKSAMRRVLLASLVKNTPEMDMIARRDMFEEAIPLLIDWETSALKVRDLLLQKTTAALSDPENYVREVARLTFDAIAAKLVDDRAYEEALPVVELAIEHDINLPLQYARRWECGFALGNHQEAEKDWGAFMKYFDKMLKLHGIPLDSEDATVWNKEDSICSDNWLAYKRGRLKNIVLRNMRLMNGQNPIGGVSSMKKTKIKSKKVSDEDKKKHRDMAMFVSREANSFPEDLRRDPDKHYRLSNTPGNRIRKIILNTSPYLAWESGEIEKFITAHCSK